MQPSLVYFYGICNHVENFHPAVLTQKEQDNKALQTTQ